jgi:ABC-type nitrate/sulfonate/bicarbonate transport system ATPase subunit
LTVEENLRAVLAKDASPSQITDMLAFVDLSGTENLYPDELSGGMKSRVSLARALLYGGDLFLLDEPFSALDLELCISLSQKLRQHLKAIGASAILVTHQREDAKLFADRIIEISPVS